MIDFRSILSPSRTRIEFPASSKKRALELAAELIVADEPDLVDRDVFDQLLVRERLGSTGLGDGVALPHCRSEESQRIIGAFLRLKDPIDFDAEDGQPVDLMFVLVVPQEAAEAHLKVLSSVARVLGDPEARSELRAAGDDASLYSQLLERLERAARE